MRKSEEMPLDPEVLAELEAIDATLAGEPVDPAHAEIAELALLLSATREQPSEQFTRTLDARVARRFLVEPVAGSPRRRARARFSSWLTRPAFASALTGGLAAVAVAVVIASGASSSGGSHPVVYNPNLPLTSATKSAGRSAASAPATSEQLGSSHSSAGTADTNLTTSLATIPTPASGGASHVIQSAQLQLSTSSTHIDEVAQEVFNVVSLESGTVKNSQVTQAANGSDGGSYATFSLSIPTANLQQAITRMSALHYTNVSARTDGTQNVSGQYQADQRHIADQKGLRAALLRQLQTAYSQSAIDSVQAQLKLAERQLSADQVALQSLRHRISYSSLQVQVNAGPIVYPLRAVNHGFTVARAAHDSLRVLVVALGVALIALAVMVPFGLLAALVAWIAFGVRRRRRRRTLDAA